MRISICILLWICGFGTILAQKQPANKIEVHYAPLYVKSNFTNLDDVIFSSFFKRRYESAAPSKGIYGYSWGMMYHRRFGKKLWAGIGASYAIFGQRSPRFYSINGVPDEILDGKSDYGGTLYKIQYKSYEVPLTFSYTIAKKNKWRYFVHASAAANVYFEVFTINYNISRATNKRERGCCIEGYGRSGKDAVLPRLRQHIKWDMWRLGFHVGGGVEYELFPFLSLKAAPEFRYYFDLFDTTEFPTIVSGRIFSAGIDFGVALRL